MMRLMAARKAVRSSGSAALADEADERRFWLTLIDLQVRKQVEVIPMNEQEMKFAKMYEDRMKLKASGQEPPPIAQPPPLKGPQVTYVGPNGERKDFKDLKEFKQSSIDKIAAMKANHTRPFSESQVFRNANPWTYTVEEGLEFDIASGKVKLTTEPEVEKKQEDEMTEEEHDQLQIERREWDAWKDTNEKGSGNPFLRPLL